MAAKTVIISKNQSLFDLAVQELGNAQAANEIAKANNMAVTYRPKAGESIIIPDSLFKKPEVVNSLAVNNRKIATGMTLEQSPSEADGIGEMIIGSTFIVY